jgi:hypothetical protein
MINSVENDTATVLGGPDDPDSWPVVGAETLALRDTPDIRKLGDAFDGVVMEARRVLRRAMKPSMSSMSASELGLATGYVQSGKTLNFTTVCALARDNAIPLIIVITGISTNLFGQSNERLQRDLRLLSRPDRKWLHIPIDTRAQSPTQRIIDTIYDWTDAGVPDGRRQTLLITVMKNYRHLDYLVRNLLSVNLDGVQTLIIDDEADQASLNYLVNRGRESTTYRQIGQLRGLIPRHAFVQYTATPQAPLLINLIDALSPSFAEVLRPGNGYTGGTSFFSRTGSQQFVRTIPVTEIFAPGQTLAAPPASFRLALATFFIGVVSGELLENAEGNRSMLVHPHQTRALHDDYFVWAENLRTDWQRALTAPDNDESRVQITELFERAYNDLRTTTDALPAFGDLIQELPRSIRRTSILEVNAARGQTPTIPWRDKYAHILVGGQAMDRGFTVEGLTVTYMPRGLGDGNADTVQQRARFFGYKKRYLGFCRVWLEQGVRDAFEEYVEHEEHMRTRLADHAATGKPLRDWKRAFFLTQALGPTRRQVVSVAFSRGNHGSRWVTASRPHELQDAVVHNGTLISRFIDRREFVENEGDPRRTIFQRHRVAHGVALQEVYEDLLEELRLPSPADSLEHTALLLQLKAWLENVPNATCSIFVMRPEAPTRTRTRTRDDDLGNFFQGANPSTGPDQGSIYPGDREIRHESDLTIQLHTFDLLPHADGEDQATYPGVQLVATFVPDIMGRDWLVQ